MPAILAIDNYDSFTFTLVDYLLTLGASVTVEKNDRISLDEAMAGPYDGVLVSPGPGAPEESGISVALAAACIAARKPLLGICLGHQAMAVACGSTVEQVAPIHGKVNMVRHDGSGLFDGLPSPVAATRYHRLPPLAGSSPPPPSSRPAGQTAAPAAAPPSGRPWASATMRFMVGIVCSLPSLPRRRTGEFLKIYQNVSPVRNTSMA